jgi:hypothetical protein
VLIENNDENCHFGLYCILINDMKIAFFSSQNHNALRAIPFNTHTLLCTRSIKFEPLRKKDQSADTNTPPEIKKFLPYPSEKMQRSKDADAHNPSETAFSNPLRNSRP